MSEKLPAKKKKPARKFSFQSDAVLGRLSSERQHVNATRSPKFAQDLLVELAEQVRGMDFHEPVGSDGAMHIRMFDRSVEETCELVDWTVSIWNQVVRPDLGYRKLTTEQLISGVLFDDGFCAWDSLLWTFDAWGEDGDDWRDYVSIESYPFPGNSDPIATPGNLCAAFGLAMLDYILRIRSTTPMDEVLDMYGVAWHFALVARSLNRQDMGHQFEIKSHSARMSRAAANRYANDPKQAAKVQVKECWQSWYEHPDKYASVASFARDMLSKWPTELTSEVVISKWVREWRREKE